MSSPAAPPPSLPEIEAEIQHHIRDVLLEDEFEGGDPLAEKELDSLLLEQLLDHLEERYLILFDPEEITRANLATVRQLAMMVARRTRDASAGRANW
jgi:acyl carrier protein